MLALLQIIFESLPLSSSGHILLIRRLAAQYGKIYAWTSLCDDLVQGPTIMIFALYFYRRWSVLLFHPYRMRLIIARCIWYGLWATIPTLYIYMLKSDNIFFPLWVGFLITGSSLVSLRWAPRGVVQSLTWWKAFLIGLAQGAALFPGISRLGITYVVARWLKVSERQAFYFSCMIESPLIIAAFIRGIISWYQADITVFLSGGFVMGLIISTIVGYVLLRLTEWLMLRKLLWYMGFYMMIPMMISFIA